MFVFQQATANWRAHRYEQKSVVPCLPVPYSSVYLLPGEQASRRYSDMDALGSTPNVGHRVG
jgi:hypothetical protein